VRTLIASILFQVAQEAEENQPEDLYPHWEELIVGAVAFAILFFFMGKWVLPRVNQMLEERRKRIQGDLEKAEQTRREAEQLLARYEERLRDARGESNRIIEEARKTAESMRKDMLAKAEDEARQVVGRAQQEIRAERDRTFEELRRHVADLSVDLASRVIGQNLDRRRQGKLVDEYIAELSKTGNGERRPAAAREESEEGRPKTASRVGGRAKGAAKKTGSAKASSSKRTASKRSPTRATSRKSTGRRKS
jgi:F-type H+-transporting ATPase subunit b